MSEPNKPDDRELDEFLSGSSPVSKEYRRALGSEGAPRELDQAVLKLARDSLPQSPRRKWHLPLALAATVVLSFSVVVALRVERTAVPTDAGVASQVAQAPAAARMEPPPLASAAESDEEMKAMRPRRANDQPRRKAKPASPEMADAGAPMAVEIMQKKAETERRAAPTAGFLSSRSDSAGRVSAAAASAPQSLPADACERINTERLKQFTGSGWLLTGDDGGCILQEQSPESGFIRVYVKPDAARNELRKQKTGRDQSQPLSGVGEEAFYLADIAPDSSGTEKKTWRLVAYARGVTYVVAGVPDMNREAEAKAIAAEIIRATVR